MATKGENVDLVIIGAGLHGLAAVKTALQLDPDVNLVVLDSAGSVGGVWAAERLYEGLRTNNQLGSYEYSDFPMDEAVPDLVRAGAHISGRAVHEYLKAYVSHFKIVDKIRLNCKVESIEYSDPDAEFMEKSWVITYRNTNTPGKSDSEGDSEARPSMHTVRTRKLIIATGLTSQPRIPTLAGEGSFNAPLFHIKEFARYQDLLLDKRPPSESIEQDNAPIAILGGSKSAWDAVYACASNGHRVNWIIRESGTGPAWMTPATVFAPLRLLLESLPLVRMLGWFSPCIWASSPIRSFLHGTWLGRLIVRFFWAALEWDMLRTNRYSEDEETAKLRPWVSPFWCATAVGILNFQSDFFEVIRADLVKVHIADVERLEPNTVVLSTGEKLESRALILCTGWKASPGIKFLPEGIEQKLGFPWAADTLDKVLAKQARKDISARFPILSSFPEDKSSNLQMHAKDASGQDANETVLHPFRLARFMVPPGLWDDRSIAFLGTVTTFNTTLVTEVQAVWALAYLNNGLEPGHQQDKESLIRETALQTEFCALRSPADHGARNADFVFEVLPYLDMLLRDLGVRTARKGSWWRELAVPYQPGDYAGLVEEWKARAEGRTGGRTTPQQGVKAKSA
ncbi:hypothetical protein BDW74DRAFT_183288 [Aspergillus multicolor]|uniref:uncharacterized protein n=1 Tax=Aspergillus multicolor TaxID=41759 RepID=UPI003CCD8ACE